MTTFHPTEDGSQTRCPRDGEGSAAEGGAMPTDLSPSIPKGRAELEGLRELLAKATPGPWEARTFMLMGGADLRDRVCHVGSSTSLGPPRSHESAANTALMAAAVNALPFLIERAEAADRAEAERGDLLAAIGFKRDCDLSNPLTRKVILDDAAGMRPAMVEARRRQQEAESDASLWWLTVEMGEVSGLLAKVWRQRKEAERRAEAAEARLSALSEERESIGRALIDEQCWRVAAEAERDELREACELMVAGKWDSACKKARSALQSNRGGEDGQ